VALAVALGDGAAAAAVITAVGEAVADGETFLEAAAVTDGAGLGPTQPRSRTETNANAISLLVIG
jgi:hypothetical protein